MFNYGVDIFVIDAWNKVEGCNTREDINKILSRLTNFAQKNNVIIFLVAHPTKMQKEKDSDAYEIPDLYSVSGSADFRNQSHDGYCVYRVFPSEKNGNEAFTVFKNLKTKMKFQGEIGSTVLFEFHIPSGRYYEKGSEPCLYKITDMYKPEYNRKIIVKKELPKVEPTEAFGEPYSYNQNDDIPF